MTIKELLQSNRLEDWRFWLDARQRQQVAFSQVYASEFAHGADGHNNMLIIARLSSLLDECFQLMPELYQQLKDADEAKHQG